MPEYCNCGAQLPPDARFCHKCGKPQSESFPLEHEEAIVQAVIAPHPVVPPPVTVEAISFHNRMAVRIGFLAAAVGSMLMSFPMPAPGLWLMGSLLLAGFFAVFLYNRRSGHPLTVNGGARMGWITGVFCFVIATVFFTISVRMISASTGLAAFYRENLKGQVANEKQLEEFLNILQTPAGMGTMILASLVILFIMFTVFPMLGGALGAKVLHRESDLP